MQPMTLDTLAGGAAVKLTYLECPCCGGDGAVSDGVGRFFDGQPLICGCPGWISLDADGDDEPWINNGDAVCVPCGIPEAP